MDVDKPEEAMQKKHPKDIAAPVINQIQGFGPPMKIVEDKGDVMEEKHVDIGQADQEVNTDVCFIISVHSSLLFLVARFNAQDMTLYGKVGRGAGGAQI